MRGSVVIGGKKRAHACVCAVCTSQAVEGEEGDVLEGGEGEDDDEYEKAPPSPSAEDHDDGDSSLADIGYLIN